MGRGTAKTLEAVVPPALRRTSDGRHSAGAFARVLVGVDGGPGGRDAIALARVLASPESELLLAHVQLRAYTPARSLLPSSEARDHEVARRLLESERSAADLDARIVTRCSESPATGLHELAAANDADLIVLGSCHRSAFGRVLLGDDTRASVRHAPCAVAVAPRGHATDARPLRAVGAGYSPSPDGEEALRAARVIARRLGAQVRALRVVPPPRVFYTGLIPPAGEGPAALVSRERTRLRVPAEVEVSVRCGLAREELAGFGASVGLLVLGTRERGHLRSLIEGTVARHLLASPCTALLLLAPCGAAASASTDTAERRTAGYGEDP